MLNRWDKEKNPFVTFTLDFKENRKVYLKKFFLSHKKLNILDATKNKAMQLTHYVFPNLNSNVKIQKRKKTPWEKHCVKASNAVFPNLPDPPPKKEKLNSSCFPQHDLQTPKVCVARVLIL